MPDSPLTPKKRGPRPMQPQPLESVNVPGVMLNIRTVELLVSMHKSTINRDIAAGTFPKPVQRSKRCSRWVSCDIRSLLDARKRGKTWHPGYVPPTEPITA